jgi:zinc protease
MGSKQRGSHWWLTVIAIALVSCGHGRASLRFGSMKVSERSFDYSPGVESFKLPNGLTVALSPEPRANLVAVDVRYLAGAIEDPAGKSGLAHVVEHMMFERRTSLDGPTLGDVLAGAALYHNAGTTWDATHYQDIALAGRLDDVLAIEATRMAGGCTGLDEAALERERAIVLQELAQRGTSEVADAILGDVFGANHRYAAGVGGHDVARLTLDDVCGFLDAHYGPRRAILVVSGRFDAPRLRRTVIEKFGAITRKATGTRAVIPTVTMIGETAEHRVDVDEAAAIVVFPAAPWGSPEAIDDALVDALLAQRLGELEREQPWITDVEAGRLGSQRGGTRYFGISVDAPAHLDEAVAAIYRAASELPGDDSGRALGAIAARRQSQLFDQFESIAERGDQCANYLQFTDHRKFHLFDLAMLQDIDVGRLRARAARMTRSASQVVRVLPVGHHGSTARPQLAAASAAIDAPIWHDTVDPAEADRPLPLPADQRFAVSEFQLANGMRVLLAPDFTQPVFEARVVFPVGDFNIGPDRAYLADAAADLLTHDPESIRSLKDFATLDWVMRLGTRLSASVDDATTFSARGTSTFADWHLWRLHWLLESGVYPEKDVELANARATRPTPHRDTGRGWRRALREALFGRDHPFARPLPTVPPTVSPDELEQFRGAHYRANGATLILAGKFDETALRKEATELFGAWSAEPLPALPPMPPMHPRPGPTWIAHADPDANQVRITFAFAATSSRQSTQGGRAAVAEMLRSRLDQVRSRLGASYGIRTSYQWSDAGDIIAVDGHVDPGRAGEVLRRMLADLDGLRQGDAELAADFVRARRTALAGALAHPMQSDAVADALESAVTHHAPIDTSSLRAAAIARTTLADARSMIAADLQPQRMVVLLSGRPADTSAAFAAAGISEYQRVDDDQPAHPPR